MVQVTFIGTGAAFSTRRRTNIAILVQAGGIRLLIECGPTVLYQLERAGSSVSQITHLFISHRHGDHILGLPMLLLMRSLGGSPKLLSEQNAPPRPLMILGNRETLQAGQKLTRTAYPELEERLDSLTWTEVSAQQTEGVALESSIQLTVLPMPHSQNAPVLGLRLDFKESGRSLVYTGDTAYHKELATFAAGCDLMVHEANFCETLQPGIEAEIYGHSTARQAGQIASQAQCGLLALVHLSPEYEGQEETVRAEAARAFEGPIFVPEDGATIYLQPVA